MRPVLACLAALAAGAALFHCSDQVDDKFPNIPPNVPDAADDGFVAPPKPEQPHTNWNPQPKTTEGTSAAEPDRIGRRAASAR